MSSSLTEPIKSTKPRFRVPKQCQSLLIYDLLVFSSHEPDPFTSAKCYPSLLLPASHRLGLIATMGQLTPHTSLVLGLPLMGYTVPYLSSQVGVHEVSLGKTICLHHMPTMLHHTSKHTSFSYFISMLHRTSLVKE